MRFRTPPIPSATVAALGLVAATACERVIINPNCPDVGATAIIVEVLDPAGNPAGLGTTVTLTGNGEAVADIGRSPDHGRFELGFRGGVYDVHVSRPWWTSRTLHSVVVRANGCGKAFTKSFEVTLSLVPGAPAVRQIVGDRIEYAASFDVPRQAVAHVEADQDLSGEIVWRSGDESLVSVTPGGLMVGTCHFESRATTLTAISVADTTVRAEFVVRTGNNIRPCP